MSRAYSGWWSRTSTAWTILLQLAAVEGAVGQVQKLVLGRHIAECVTEAIRSGSPRERQKKMDELLEVFSRFGG